VKSKLLKAFLKQATRGLPRKVRQEVQDELEEHLLEQQYKFRACGDSELEATRKAIANVGQATQISSGLRGVHMWPKVYTASGMLAVMLFGIGFWTLRPASLAQKSSLERGILEGQVTVGVRRIQEVQIVGNKVPTLWEEIFYFYGPSLDRVNSWFSGTPMLEKSESFILSRAKMDSKGNFSLELPNNSIERFLVPARVAFEISSDCKTPTGKEIIPSDLQIANVQVYGYKLDQSRGETLNNTSEKVTNNHNRSSLIYTNQAGRIRQKGICSNTSNFQDTDLQLQAGWNWITTTISNKCTTTNCNTWVWQQRVGKGSAIWEGLPDELVRQSEAQDRRLEQRLKALEQKREQARANTKS
jgi:hypothetical protein